MTSGIYSIRNLVNDKIYIGSAVNFDRRIAAHFSTLRRNCHKNPHLQNSFNKYGEESFIWEILEIIEDVSKLISVEEAYIKMFDVEDRLYNICKEVPSSRLGSKMTTEAKQKISKAQIGNKHALGTKHTEEYNNAIRNRLKGNTYRRNTKHSDESKKMISENNIGRIISDETREKISKKNSGMKRTEESKQKMRESRLRYLEKKRND